MLWVEVERKYGGFVLNVDMSGKLALITEKKELAAPVVVEEFLK